MKRKYAITILTHAGKTYNFNWACDTSKLLADEPHKILMSNEYICVALTDKSKTMVPKSAISSIKCVEKGESKLD